MGRRTPTRPRDNYPYSQQANLDGLPPNSGLQRTFNYVRNSVKVVVDAYDGSMRLLRHRPQRSDHPGLREGVPRPVHRRQQADTLDPGHRGPLPLPRGPLPGPDQHVRPLPPHRSQRLLHPGPSVDRLPRPGQRSPAIRPARCSPDHAHRHRDDHRPPVQQLAPQYILAHLPGSTQQSFLLVTPFVPVGGRTRAKTSPAS